MKESLVTSRKLSQRLKKLGIKQESEWYWNMNSEEKFTLGKRGCFCISAFLCGELLEILPKRIPFKDGKYETGAGITIEYNDHYKEFGIHYPCRIKPIWHKSPAESLGLMWEHLKEKGLVK